MKFQFRWRQHNSFSNLFSYFWLPNIYYLLLALSKIKNKLLGNENFVVEHVMSCKRDIFRLNILALNQKYFKLLKMRVGMK